MLRFQMTFPEGESRFETGLSSAYVRYSIGPGLKLEGNTLSVDMADVPEENGVRPLSSGGAWRAYGPVIGRISNTELEEILK